MKLNKKRYRELIKDSQKLDQHEKHLSDISESDYLELLGYSVKTSARLELELLDCYLNLLEQFLEGRISAGGLFSEYVKLQNWQEKIHNRLKSNLISIILYISNGTVIHTDWIKSLMHIEFLL